MSGPAAKSLVLSEHERSVLTAWVKRPTSPARLVQRARIVLAYADSGQVSGVARQAGVSAATVTKWRDRFVAARLGGLDDAPRPGQPRKLSDERVLLLSGRSELSQVPSSQVTGAFVLHDPLKRTHNFGGSRLSSVQRSGTDGKRARA